MGAARRIRDHLRAIDFGRSIPEFLLGIAFVVLATLMLSGWSLPEAWLPHVELWIIYELAAAFIMGLAHFVTYDDDRLPLWSRIVFVACLGFYIVWIVRHAWFVVLPLLGAKVFSLWLHGTLTDEQFGYRVLKGMYLVVCLVAGMIAYAVLDAVGAWTDRGEAPWILALMVGGYYLGLGAWQAVLEGLKRMPDATVGSVPASHAE